MRLIVIVILFFSSVQAQEVLRPPFYTARAAVVTDTCGCMLDSVATQAKGGYSLRRLSLAYHGALIRVRRIAGDSLDIGYNSGNVLDTAALKTFVGSGDGWVRKWFDQSGSGNDLKTLGNAADEPKIMVSGVIQRQNGLPTILWADNSLFNSNISTTVANGFTYISVAKGAEVNYSIISGAGISIGIRWARGQGGIATYGHGWGGVAAGVALGSDATYSVFKVKSFTKTSAQWDIRSNNGSATTVADASMPSTATHYLCVGAELQSGVAYGFNGNISEFIFYNEVNSTNRQIIERNQGRFYGITVL